MEQEGNPQKNLTWDKEQEQALQSVSRNPGRFHSWESFKNETNLTVSGLYKPLISNRSGFLPRPRDWSTHPPRPRRVDGKQARSVTDSGFKELLQAVARLWLPTVLLPTYWSEIQASCNLLIYFLQLIDLFLSFLQPIGIWILWQSCSTAFVPNSVQWWITESANKDLLKKISFDLHFRFSSLQVSRWISWLKARTDFQISRFDFWHFSAVAVGAFQGWRSLTSSTAAALAKTCFSLQRTPDQPFLQCATLSHLTS